MDESLPFEVVLGYVEVNDFGVWADMECSGEWIDSRDKEDEEDEGIG